MWINHGHPGNRCAVEYRQQLGGFVQADGALDELLWRKRPLSDQAQHGGVVRGRHAMTAQKVKLPADHPFHGHPWVSLHRRQQADLDMPTPAAQTEDRISRCLLAADGINRDLASTAAEFADQRGDISRAVSDHGVLGPQLLSQGQRLGIAVHCDHPGVKRPGNHDRTQADSAGANDAHPLVLPETGASGQRPVGRGETAAQARRSSEVDLLGDRHNIDISGVQRHILGERAPMGEAGLLLRWTDLRLAGPAPLAGAAATDERHCHPVSGFRLLHLRTGLHDDASQLMARHMGVDQFFMAGPGMPVAAAHPGGHDFHQHTISRDLGDRH